MRKKLHQLIDSVDDQKAAAIYKLCSAELDIDLHRKNGVLEEREKYLRGEGRSYNREEVKQMALGK